VFAVLFFGLPGGLVVLLFVVQRVSHKCFVSSLSFQSADATWMWHYVLFFLLFHLAFIAVLAFAALELLQYFILKNHRLQ